MMSKLRYSLTPTFESRIFEFDAWQRAECKCPTEVTDLFVVVGSDLLDLVQSAAQTHDSSC